jgi:HD-like signal output (HDOD) protein
MVITKHAPASDDPAISLRESRLDSCVARISQGEGIPPFASHVKELLARTLDPDTVLSQMTGIVLKDLGLTSQLLRAANSSFYNRSSRPIISVSRAITLLGWDTVASLVGAVRFVEHFIRRSPGLRELMMLSLLTASHVRYAASAVGYPRPEDAYVCGLFRNLGEVLIARYYGREYADVLLAIETDHITEQAACLRVFGFDFDDLARRLAILWDMPRVVRLCLKADRTAATPEERCLVSLATYGHELTSSLYRSASTNQFMYLRPVVTPAGTECLISQRDMKHIVDSAIGDTRQILVALSIPLASLQLDAQAEHARNMLEDAEPSSIRLGLAELDSAVSGVAGRLDSPSFELSGYIKELLDILISRAHFDRAIFALLSEDGNSIRGRLGSGNDANQGVERFRFSLTRYDPLLDASIRHKQDLWIDRKTDSRYERSSAITALDPSHFVVLPVIVDGVVAGALFADRKKSQPSDDLRSRVDQIRLLIAAAIAKMRN